MFSMKKQTEKRRQLLKKEVSSNNYKTVRSKHNVYSDIKRMVSSLCMLYARYSDKGKYSLTDSPETTGAKTTNSPVLRNKGIRQ